MLFQTSDPLPRAASELEAEWLRERLAPLRFGAWIVRLTRGELGQRDRVAVATDTRDPSRASASTT